MHHDAIYAVRALRVGVSGFVLKNSASLELLTALKTVLNGQTYVSAEMAEQLTAYSQGANKELEESLSLTPRQRGCCSYLQKGTQHGEVAEVLHISVRTAENHKAHIMSILGANSTAELIRCALRLGLISN